jgi:hypothetical protein
MADHETWQVAGAVRSVAGSGARLGGWRRGAALQQRICASRWGWLAVASSSVLLALLGEFASGGPNDAAGVIEGRVIDGDGRGVPGLRIRAYDADSVGNDDPIAEAQTDQRGRYRLQYPAQTWDCCRGFRDSDPDIYAELWIQGSHAGRKPGCLGRSRVFRNHSPAVELAIDFEVP